MKRRDELQQLASKSETDLTKETAALREKLWNLREELVAGKVKNVRQMRSLKRSLARAMTRMTTVTKK